LNETPENTIMQEHILAEDNKKHEKKEYKKGELPSTPPNIPGLNELGTLSEEKWKVMFRHFRIGEHMLQRKLITVTQLADLLDEQQRTGEQLGELVIQKGIISRKGLLDLLKWQHQADQVIMGLLIDLEKETTTPEESPETTDSDK
jgi:hypothetical protein